MKVLIPSALRSYTDTARSRPAARRWPRCSPTSTASYPGIRFRMIDEQKEIRPHIRFFLNGEQLRDLAQPLPASGELIIVQALSGG
jgi:molybdopterin synthase sulfur carrier subunit